MNDSQIYDEAAKLVMAMNPLEAKRFHSSDPQTWPQWAVRDFDLAFRALKRAAGRPPNEPVYIVRPKRARKTL